MMDMRSRTIGKVGKYLRVCELIGCQSDWMALDFLLKKMLLKTKDLIDVWWMFEHKKG